MKENERPRSVERSLTQISESINKEQFMLMEYLGPVVDGCRTALGISIERARDLHKLTDKEFEAYMESTGQAFRDIAFCFRSTDTEERYSFVFEKGKAVVYDECVEPDVVVRSDRETLLAILDSDPHFSLVEVLGESLEIVGQDSLNVVEALGFLCYPSLLRVARSGVDPSSLLSEDADSIILATASDLVTNLVRRWIDLQLSEMDSPA